MVSKADMTVRPKLVTVYNAISSDLKRLVVLVHSPHVMLLGPEADHIFSLAEEFFNSVSHPTEK